jgi:hypothetical protein
MISLKRQNSYLLLLFTICSVGYCMIHPQQCCWCRQLSTTATSLGTGSSAAKTVCCRCCRLSISAASMESTVSWRADCCCRRRRLPTVYHCCLNEDSEHCRLDCMKKAQSLVHQHCSLHGEYCRLESRLQVQSSMYYCSLHGEHCPSPR